MPLEEVDLNTCALFASFAKKKQKEFGDRFTMVVPSHSIQKSGRVKLRLFKQPTVLRT